MPATFHSPSTIAAALADLEALAATAIPTKPTRSKFLDRPLAVLRELAQNAPLEGTVVRIDLTAAALKALLDVVSMHCGNIEADCDDEEDPNGTSSEAYACMAELQEELGVVHTTLALAGQI